MMEIMSQERYKEYRQSLKDQGYRVYETKTLVPDEDTFNKLEQRIGKMPWNALKNIPEDSEIFNFLKGF